jgi:hypothetical protein
MKLLLGGIFSVSIKYVYQRGNTYYYQRKIPQDLLPRYPGTTHIKVNLKTSEPALVARKVRVGFPQFHGHIVKHIADFQTVPG